MTIDKGNPKEDGSVFDPSEYDNDHIFADLVLAHMDRPKLFEMEAKDMLGDDWRKKGAKIVADLVPSKKGDYAKRYLNAADKTTN